MELSGDNHKGPEPSNRSGREGRVPTPAVRRLSLYLRELEALQRSNRQTFSSRQLGDALSLTDAQVRKDLAYFGQFGRPGKGYSVSGMIARIRQILGTDRTWTALLVGVGNLGTALLSYRGFFGKGFEIVAAFDNDPSVIGQVLGLQPGIRIQPLEQLETVITDHGVQMAILCVPADAAQVLADRLVAAGVKGILNFAPRTLTVPETVSLASVDLAQRLEQLAFHICANQVLQEKAQEI
jgi:redox-sensing transcriptional repressor